ncbi:DUF2812 domain-containing protein [Paenibacillus sp. FSL R7-0345]|uniref:DUF2812 domain-containing protein n=1 Tax=Paenibacillus sp. FSL R7-0345 TaxID=2954535 RepID=UPI00315AF0C9
MKTVYRPFWSYDLQQTEAWLSEMSAQGWLPAGWNLKLRQFTFRRDNPARLTWQISYDPAGSPEVPGALAAGGWRKHMQQGKWTLYANSGQPEQIKIYPSRKPLLKRNRNHSMLFTGLTVYAAATAAIPLVFLTASALSSTPVHIVPSPMWLVTGLAAVLILMLLLLALLSLHKIRKENKHFYHQKQNLHTPDSLPQSTGQKAIRLKLGWMYSPDRLEKWLEAQEHSGYNLYKVGRLGTLFYFTKGSPRQVRYHADCQFTADPDYFELHRSAGWKNLYTTSFSTQKWTLWSREYSAGEERPQMYSDPFHRLKHARRIAMYYTLLFLPMLLLYSLNLTTFISVIGGDWGNSTLLTNILLMFVSIIIFGSFVGRTWLYYRRLKLSLN